VKTEINISKTLLILGVAITVGIRIAATKRRKNNTCTNRDKEHVIGCTCIECEEEMMRKENSQGKKMKKTEVRRCIEYPIFFCHPDNYLECNGCEMNWRDKSTNNSRIV
jgi:hypothetical protein